jgi:hypothetical protein
MLQVTQNNCVICLENESLLNPLNNKASYFNCSCSIYFHKDCWKTFINNQNKCPYCRIISPIPVPIPLPIPLPIPDPAVPNNILSLIKKYNIFLLLTQILISPACVLNTIGLVELQRLDNHISEIIIITSAIYLDFVFILIFDCNTNLFLNNLFRKLFIAFNLYKIIILIFSTIVISLGHLNNNQHILYGTICYISSYCMVTLLAVITYLTSA